MCSILMFMNIYADFWIFKPVFGRKIETCHTKPKVQAQWVRYEKQLIILDRSDRRALRYSKMCDLK